MTMYSSYALQQIAGLKPQQCQQALQLISSYNLYRTKLLRPDLVERRFGWSRGTLAKTVATLSGIGLVEWSAQGTGLAVRLLPAALLPQLRVEDVEQEMLEQVQREKLLSGAGLQAQSR